jgi:hypothetical protein
MPLLRHYAIILILIIIDIISCHYAIIFIDAILTLFSPLRWYAITPLRLLIFIFDIDYWCHCWLILIIDAIDITPLLMIIYAIIAIDIISLMPLILIHFIIFTLLIISLFFIIDFHWYLAPLRHWWHYCHYFAITPLRHYATPLLRHYFHYTLLTLFSFIFTLISWYTLPPIIDAIIIDIFDITPLLTLILLIIITPLMTLRWYMRLLTLSPLLLLIIYYAIISFHIDYYFRHIAIIVYWHFTSLYWLISLPH